MNLRFVLISSAFLFSLSACDGGSDSVSDDGNSDDGNNVQDLGSHYGYIPDAVSEIMSQDLVEGQDSAAGQD